jgi:hypothetical protein
MTLDEAIEQLVTLGEKDPAEIVKKLQHRHGEKWLRTQVAARAEEVTLEFARRILGSARRRGELALRAGDAMSQAEMQITTAWVPGVGWKVAADLTRDDLLARAGWYERFADASLRRAEWCRDVVARMDDEGVERLGDISELPPLPRGEIEEAA